MAEKLKHVENVQEVEKNITSNKKSNLVSVSSRYNFSRFKEAYENNSRNLQTKSFWISNKNVYLILMNSLCLLWLTSWVHHFMVSNAIDVNSDSIKIFENFRKCLLWFLLKPYTNIFLPSSLRVSDKYKNLQFLKVMVLRSTTKI